MSDMVKIQINLVEGNVLVEAPVEALDTVFNRLESFLPKFTETKEDMMEGQLHDIQRDDFANESKENKEEYLGENKKLNQKPTKKKINNSKAESYKVVDLGLEPAKRTAYREFYDEKHPANQNQQILVAMYWLIKEAQRQYLSKDDIYTGLKTVNARVPARISSVLSNLMLDGKVISEEGKYTLHHTGEDYVAYDLPEKKTSGK